MIRQDRQSLLDKMRLTMWTCAGLFAIGYFPAVMGRPVLSMSLAPLAIIPWCLKERSVKRTMIGGTAMGLLAGASITMGLQSFMMEHPSVLLGPQTTQPAGAHAATKPKAAGEDLAPGPASTQSAEVTTQPAVSAPEYLCMIRPYLHTAAWRIMPGVTLMCASISAVFAIVGRRRRRRTERQWQ
ncbi:MAG: hypothetical protein J7M14_03545 [Planctomycetes bacterium]|nr:hypothetical protein [Planctomycetota bacterium]